MAVHINQKPKIWTKFGRLVRGFESTQMVVHINQKPKIWTKFGRLVRGSESTLKVQKKAQRGVLFWTLVHKAKAL